MMSGMAERAVIEASAAPQTRASIATDLHSLGVAPGSVLLVHTAVSRLGWVCGGPVAVAQALLDVLGPDGTLVVPTHTTGNSDPARWGHPPVPDAWWPVIREHMPGFDPRITPSRGVGALPEVVRTLPGAVRSAHPQMSFAAIGPQARQSPPAMSSRADWAKVHPSLASTSLTPRSCCSASGMRATRHCTSRNIELPSRAIVERAPL